MRLVEWRDRVSSCKADFEADADVKPVRHSEYPLGQDVVEQDDYVVLLSLADSNTSYFAFLSRH